MKFNTKNPFNWMMICFVLSVIAAVLHNKTGILFFYYAIFVLWIYPIGLAITAIAFAWFINPIKALIAWIKKKRE